MAGGDDGSGGRAPGGPSYDPRTWIGPGAASPVVGKAPKASQAAGAAEPSFDPKTWFGPAGPPESPPPEPPPPETPPPAPGPSRRGLVAAGAAGLAAAAGGGVFWAVTRQRPGPGLVRARPTLRAAGPGGAPPAMATATSDDGSKVLLDADSLQHLKIQLRYGYGVSDKEAQAATEALGQAMGGEHGKLHVVLLVGAAHGDADQIRWLTARRVDGFGVRLDRVDDAFVATSVSSALTERLCATNFGTMNDQSFYSSATSVFHDDLLIAQFVAAMAYDFNFAHEVPPGSRFRGVYEESRDADGNLIGPRRLKLAVLEAKAIDDEVEFAGVRRSRHAAAKTRRLYLFDAGRDGRTAWYDEVGRSAVRGLMRTPVEGARVTSKFGPRMHPIFETVKIHEGVDFGCPVGTPVFAAADGVVAIAAPVHGYGNYLRISHGPHMWTAYGHLSAYPASTTPGAKVSQGQVVAFTGNTGNSTGPHLHYEIRIDGVAVDPLSYQTTQTVALTGAQLEAFRKERDRMDAASRECA